VTPTDVAGPDLLADTAELVSIPSLSHHEGELADLVEVRLRRVPSLVVERIGHNVVARTELGRASRLVLGGHLDTVPPNGNAHPSLDGDRLHGLGAADMKGGLAVMLALAAFEVPPALDVTWVFYAAEEVARVHNGLLAIAEVRPELLEGDAAILGEPTAGRIEAGCQGVLKASVTLRGARAHSARPWTGINAIHRLTPILEAVRAYRERRPVIDGCEYREALQAVNVEGGVAANVVPDQATVMLNHRFAPDRNESSAELALRGFIEPLLDPALGDHFDVVDSSPAAPPGLGHPLLRRLVDATGAAPRAKLGWTDVAFFAERGIPAVNYGPGDPEVAHTANEWVSRRELDSVYATLTQVLRQS
jgi:succinyl-diaminopimelate desuccinylase